MLSCPAELQELLIDLGDATQDGEEMESLGLLLEQDASARSYYIRYMNLHARLELMHDPPLGEQSSDQLFASPPSYDGILSRVSLAARRSAQSLTYRARHPSVGELSVALATLVMSLGVLMLALVSWPVQRTNRPVQIAAQPFFSAKLSKEVQCSWNGDPPSRANWLAAGAQFSLDSGMAEFEFEDGARMLVEGPATFTLQGIQSALLSHGKATVSTRNSDSGFTLDTPVATLTDLGTEFGVQVLGDGQTLAEVFAGLVEFSPLAGRGLNETKMLLRTGEVAELRSAPGSTVDRVAVNTAVFARQVPNIYCLFPHEASGLLRSNGQVAPGPNLLGSRRVGTSQATGVGLAVAYLFRLPEVENPSRISSATLTMRCESVDGAPEFGVDLYGLGHVETPGLSTAWFYEGPDERTNNRDTTSLRITPSVIDPGKIADDGPSPVRLQVDTALLLQYIRGLYINGAQGGDLAVFRLSPAVTTDGLPRSTGYNFTIPDAAGRRQPISRFAMLTLYVDNDSSNGGEN